MGRKSASTVIRGTLRGSQVVVPVEMPLDRSRQSVELPLNRLKRLVEEELAKIESGAEIRAVLAWWMRQTRFQRVSPAQLVLRYVANEIKDSAGSGTAACLDMTSGTYDPRTNLYCFDVITPRAGIGIEGADLPPQLLKYLKYGVIVD